jgi:hypothetical protein
MLPTTNQQETNWAFRVSHYSMPPMTKPVVDHTKAGGTADWSTMGFVQAVPPVISVESPVAIKTLTAINSTAVICNGMQASYNILIFDF